MHLDPGWMIAGGLAGWMGVKWLQKRVPRTIVIARDRLVPLTLRQLEGAATVSEAQMRLTVIANELLRHGTKGTAEAIYAEVERINAGMDAMTKEEVN